MYKPKKYAKELYMENYKITGKNINIQINGGIFFTDWKHKIGSLGIVTSIPPQLDLLIQDNFNQNTRRIFCGYPID